jgi:phosphoribosylformylglycinamidine synthase subunit PurL
VGADLLKLMASPNLASRRWIWEQYDSQVGADTLQTGGDAAVVRVHGTKKALAITTDCTPRYCYADPYEGGKQAIAEAYRNLCAVGAKPLAVTNCLNFANPQRPEIMAQFVGCLEGMGRGLPRARLPDRLGQRQPLQREQGDRRRQRHPADPGDRRRRPDRRRRQQG